MDILFAQIQLSDVRMGPIMRQLDLVATQRILQTACIHITFPNWRFHARKVLLGIKIEFPKASLALSSKQLQHHLLSVLGKIST